MSKLFLDTKTLYYDVSGFMFYVLTEQVDGIDVFVGYFSKVSKSIAILEAHILKFAFCIRRKSPMIITTSHASWFYHHINERDTAVYLLN